MAKTATKSIAHGNPERVPTPSRDGLRRAKPVYARRVLFTALFAIGVVAGARGCGGVTDERVAARTQASKAACDKSQMCGIVGPGLTYESYQSCITIVNGMIDQTYLPEAQCKDIDQSALSVCISAINGILCNDIVDLYLTLVVTCSKDRLCVGFADAGSD